MASSTTTLVLEHYTKIDPIVSSGNRDQALAALGNTIGSLAVGAAHGVALEVRKNSSAPVKSYGSVILSSGSGAITIVINGITAGSETWATSDTATAVLLAADINASTDALVQYLVEASNFTGTATLASVAAGEYIALTLSDGRKWRFTAVATAAAADATKGEFGIDGTDTADAAALAAAINGMPILNHHVFATSSSGVVTIYQRRGTSANVVLGGAGAGLTLAAIASSATVGVSCLHPGTIGNAVTLAATGTGATASGARLTGGAGANASPVRFDL
jgi:hypothetical protein